MARRWDYYPDGITVGGLKILERAESGATTTDTTYRIRYLCCGATDTITHLAINQRKKNHSVACRDCSNRRAAEVMTQKREEAAARKKADADQRAKNAKPIPRGWDLLPLTWDGNQAASKQTLEAERKAGRKSAYGYR